MRDAGCRMRDAGCEMRDAEPASRIPHPTLKLELVSVTVCLSINFRLVIAVHAVHVWG